MFKDRELEPTFTAIGDDWIRISALCWILWTDKPAAHVFTLLQRLLDQTDQVLISRLDSRNLGGSDMFGHLEPWIWNWLNSKSPNVYVTGQAATEMQYLPRAAFSNDENS